jgi:carboxypeptidase Taq
MSYTNLNDAVARLDEIEATVSAYSHAMGILSLDAATAAPLGAAEGRGKTMAVLSGVVYDLAASADTRELIDYLSSHMEELDEAHRRQVEIQKKSCEQMVRIPQEEYIAYNVLLNKAEGIWRVAKIENDFAAFSPVLEEIVAFNRKFAGYYDPNKAPYDALLNEYEEGLNMETLDAFFAELRRVIVPLIRAVGEKPQPDTSFLDQCFPIEGQKELAKYLMEVIGLDPNYCTIAESEHPFTCGFNCHDVRITTHYHEEHPTFAMFSTIHEGGHALYELGVDERYNGTCLGGGASMSIHESQSRFYENIIGRSREFIELIFPKMQEIFPRQLQNVTAEDLYRAVNKAQPSLIRTESDELTYAMHVMVRYEVEKQLIGGTLEVKDVPAEWNRLYREYLGVDVPNDTLGCLQDSHWSGGAIGYFPSYALGSAYGAQMKHVCESEIGPIAPIIARGDIGTVTAWLREHIHRFGNFKKPAAIFEDACGKFDAKFFADYLTEKYTELYAL